METIRSTTLQYRCFVEETVNETMRRMMEKLDSNGDGRVQMEDFKNHASAALNRIRDHTPTPTEIGVALSHFTWAEMIWRYFLLQLTFLVALFVIENIRDLVFSGPRRLLLDDSYLTNNPPEVGPEIALTYDTPWTLYERTKVVFFVVTGLLFLRIFCFFFCAVTSMYLISLTGLNGRNRRDNPYWFAIWSNIACVFAHIGAAAAGIYHVKLFGRVADGSECKILIGNHSCIMEVTILCIIGNFPSFVTRKENAEKVPCFADVVRVMDAVTVDRGASESRKYTADAIRKRAKNRNPKAPQIMIFPEGTTANQRALFMFRKGAMEPGEPIQMICVSIPYKHFNPCWTGRACGGNNISDLLLRLCSQFVTHVEVRALPVYTPTDDERNDAALYAKRCQQMMATVLQCCTSSCTYRDYERIQRKKDRVSAHSTE
ncbi:putative acyltransferase [Trypanosoma grayi]|uniref:putative acyltransferase n=1 Tax=Trypanosoma grayi TaxID=71804 RepID=UPI0004F406E6|nr:putative acyltransferase [Trypanosoma grayi]KEG10413.1 putative acyltransferase [Trypanosoma grayi]